MSANNPLVILLVEDEVTLRQTLGSLLCVMGYSVVEAGHGHEALERLAEAIPDAIVSDLDMPVMDGRAFCAALAAHPHWNKIPILLMTGHAYPMLEEILLRLPHCLWIGKPFTFEQFGERLRSLFRPSSV
jgi:chemosensory pili system protein ChpA (sensor histidine kinase/response regulator)